MMHAVWRCCSGVIPYFLGRRNRIRNCSMIFGSGMGGNGGVSKADRRRAPKLLSRSTPFGTARYFSAVSPHLLDRWRGEWRAKGDMAFPGIGRRGVSLPAVDDARRIGELERKIGQLTMENDFLKKALQHFREYHPPAVVTGGDACLKKSNRPRRKAKP